MDTIKVNKMPQMEVTKGTEKKLTHEFVGLKVEKRKNIGIYIGAVIIIFAGILTGYFLSGSGKQGSGKLNIIENKKVVGSLDTKTFPDSAEGILEKGGIDGEGTHKLVRPGGESQTVYLTSSVVDLNTFIGKKVKVWGQTQSAEKAGWFMDVGRVEIF